MDNKNNKLEILESIVVVFGKRLIYNSYEKYKTLHLWPIVQLQVFKVVKML